MVDATDLAVDPAGWVWQLAGRSGIMLFKHDSDGVLQPRFPVLVNGSASAIAAGPDGTIWVTGFVSDDWGNDDMALWKFE